MKLVSAMVAASPRDSTDAPGKVQLLLFKWIMEMPIAAEPLQRLSIRDLNTRPNRELQIVRSVELTHR
jgi:hypothetical protein